MLSEKEKAVLDALVEAWNKFYELPVEHGDDRNEFRVGIHALQNMVLARPTRNEFNKVM